MTRNFPWYGGNGLAGTGQCFESTPGMSPGLAFAALANLIEFDGGLPLVVCLFTRPVALAKAVFMGVALSVHVPGGIRFSFPRDGFDWGSISMRNVVLR